MKDWQDYLGSFKWLNAFRGFRKSLWFMLFQKLTVRSFFAPPPPGCPLFPLILILILKNYIIFNIILCIFFEFIRF